MRGLIYLVLIKGILAVFYRVGRLDAEWHQELERQDGFWAGAGLPVLLIMISRKDCMLEELCLVVLAACLWMACVMDLRNQSIYNYVWIPALAGGILCLYRGRAAGSREQLFWLLGYILLQECFFAGMYGRADCHGFVVCAVCEAGIGIPLVGIVLHMAFTFLLLAVVQGCRHNIASNGNLKTPVPLLPYLTAAFWLLYYFYCIFIQT